MQKTFFCLKGKQLLKRIKNLLDLLIGRGLISDVRVNKVGFLIQVYTVFSMSSEESCFGADDDLMLFSFICFNSETLQFAQFFGRKRLTAAASTSTEEGRMVTNTCLELLISLQ